MGLESVHEKRVLHRDLHPGNVLIHQTQTVAEKSCRLWAQLSDFGLSTMCRDEIVELAGEIYPVVLRPPEVLLMGGLLKQVMYQSKACVRYEFHDQMVRYSFPADVWNAGTFFHWICSGSPFWLPTTHLAREVEKESEANTLVALGMLWRLGSPPRCFDEHEALF